jgi:hypothetical protein
MKAFLACAIGVGVGLAASAYVLSGASPFDRVRLGPWEIVAHAGSIESDPYTRASLERSGEIPLAVGEGLQLIAREDDDGRPLDARCVYEVGPRVPAARYWTLSVIDPDGWPIENAAQRYGFRSSEILRAANGDFAVTVSAEAAPGNWLPVGAAGPFVLALRLYDSPLAATAGGIEKTTAPHVARIGCA